jgi:hypothetical protein
MLCACWPLLMLQCNMSGLHAICASGGRQLVSALKGLRRLIGAAGTGAALAALVASVPFAGLPSAHAASTASNLPMPEPETAGSERHFRLLTTAQYVNTLTYLFGNDIKIETQFAPLRRTDGLLALNASTAGLTDTQLEVYQKIASLVASQVMSPERRSLLVPCKPADHGKADRACAARFVADVSRRLYRRTLNEARAAEIVDEADKAANALGDFYLGLESALEAMLVSPNVLFLAERSMPDPRTPGRHRLDDASLASRLSLFLWNAAPDEMLLRAAESGELRNPRGLTRVVDRMLASPRLEAGLRAFFDDMYAFDTFTSLAKDAAVYPGFTGLTASDAREQTLRTVVDHIAVKNRDYRDLFTTRDTFMSPSLAVIYGAVTGPKWEPYTFASESPRAGVLTHVSFLALHSHPGRSSATLRGKALRELLLCQKVPLPPANVDFSALENPKPGLRTARDRVGEHLANPVCAGCHKITDPIGLSLENFDGSGKYRETEKGAPIDASGTLDGVNFTDIQGLGRALRDHPALSSCLVQRMYSYGTGGPTKPGDRPLLDNFTQRFTQQGYRVKDLMRTIALSNAFSSVVEKEEQTAAAP